MSQLFFLIRAGILPVARISRRLIMAVALPCLLGAAAGQSPSAPGPAKPRSAAATQDYVLGPGDIIKITVFQFPDLAIETRVSENGTITYPMIGTVVVGGASTSVAEKEIARKLKSGGFLVDPQVNVLIEQIHGNQVAALGQFNHPGRYPLETTQMRVSDLVALAGGIAPTGSDTVVFTGVRQGKEVRQEIDISKMFVGNRLANDFLLQSGDVLFVDRFAVFYIYGEVQHPGAYRAERNMTLAKALAAGGGLTPRGTQRGVRLKREDAKGQLVELKPELDDPIKPEDVIYVQESLF